MIAGCVTTSYSEHQKPAYENARHQWAQKRLSESCMRARPGSTPSNMPLERFNNSALRYFGSDGHSTIAAWPTMLHGGRSRLHLAADSTATNRHNFWHPTTSSAAKHSLQPPHSWGTTLHCRPGTASRGARSSTASTNNVAARARAALLERTRALPRTALPAVPYSRARQARRTLRARAREPEIKLNHTLRP